jgi:Ni,Fe-hydrogenase III small subunit/Pyruvate/2-oxoacid:ferredoxin oxidoreductase delta subunit
MLNVIKTRIAQKYRTGKYPKKPPVMPDRFKGLPECSFSKCGKNCDLCVSACPVQAIEKTDSGTKFDLGKCVFCGACVDACPDKLIQFTQNHSLCARRREDLILTGNGSLPACVPLEAKRLKLFKRSLKLRQVSAGGCNACEADTNVLNTLFFDLARFGIQFVASPRHADGLLVTGPVTKNMELALKKTWEATPSPKVVIAVGACAISGGMFAKHGETCRGVDEILPVDLYIPGCPPHPYTILDGLLKLIGRI